MIENNFTTNYCSLSSQNYISYCNNCLFTFQSYPKDVCKIHGEKCGNICFTKGDKTIGRFCLKCYNELINSRTEEYVNLLKQLICETDIKDNLS